MRIDEAVHGAGCTVHLALAESSTPVVTTDPIYEVAQYQIDQTGQFQLTTNHEHVS